MPGNFLLLVNNQIKIKIHQEKKLFDGGSSSGGGVGGCMDECFCSY